MKQCKILQFLGFKSLEQEEREINKYLSSGYEIKAVCSSSAARYVYLEKNVDLAPNNDVPVNDFIDPFA